MDKLILLGLFLTLLLIGILVYNTHITENCDGHLSDTFIVVCEDALEFEPFYPTNDLPMCVGGEEC